MGSACQPVRARVRARGFIDGWGVGCSGVWGGWGVVVGDDGWLVEGVGLWVGWRMWKRWGIVFEMLRVGGLVIVEGRSAERAQRDS